MVVICKQAGGQGQNLIRGFSEGTELSETWEDAGARRPFPQMEDEAAAWVCGWLASRALHPREYARLALDPVSLTHCLI